MLPVTPLSVRRRQPTRRSVRFKTNLESFCSHRGRRHPESSHHVCDHVGRTVPASRSRPSRLALPSASRHRHVASRARLTVRGFSAEDPTVGDCTRSFRICNAPAPVLARPRFHHTLAVHGKRSAGYRNRPSRVLDPARWPSGAKYLPREPFEAARPIPTLASQALQAPAPIQTLAP
jgi:hypothetical protein